MQLPTKFFSSATQLLRNRWPEFVVLVIVTVIGILNFIPNTWLIGWDHYSPQLHLSEAVSRNIFGSWQEDRGLGIPDGLSHTANFTHTLLSAVFSLFLPDNQVRYLLQLTLYALGMLGSIALAKEYGMKKLQALITALAYGGNLATLQLFYLPLEVFSFHFVALPWLILLGKKYLDNTQKRAGLIFFIAAFLLSPQAYVPTLFIVFGGVFMLVLGSYTLQHKKILGFVQLSMLLLVSQLFWLVPYASNFPSTLQHVSSSSINLLSSPEVTLNNREYGLLSDVLLGKGVYLSFLESGALQSFAAQPLRALSESTQFIAIMVILAVFFVCGAATSFWKRSQLGFLLVAVLFAVLLSTRQPGSSMVIEWMQEHLPAYAQAYRFTFTKFSLAFVFAYSMLIGFGLTALENLLGKSKIYLSSIVMIAILQCYLFLPAFQGNFFYVQLQQTIPHEYFSLQAFFNVRPADQRVLVLPQSEIWGWTYTNWGFQGSGFIWQVLKQPTLDGAFLPWHSNNETAYLQIEDALETNNQEQLLEVLRKYHITWIIFDKTLIHTPLSITRIQEILDTQAAFSKETEFGDLVVYRFEPEASEAFVTVPQQFAVVGEPVQFSTVDIAYQQFGPYVSQSDHAVYPFAQVQSTRDLSERVRYENDTVVLQGTLPEKLTVTELRLPLHEEPFSLVTVSVHQDSEKVVLDFRYPFELYADEVSLFETELAHIELPLEQDQEVIAITINSTLIDLTTGALNQYLFLPDLDTVQFEVFGLPTAQLSAQEESIDAVLLQSGELDLSPVWTAYDAVANTPVAIAAGAHTFTATFLSQPIKKLAAESDYWGNCDPLLRGTVRAEPQGESLAVRAEQQAIGCVNYGFQQFSNDLSYLLRIQSQQTSGLPAQIHVLNWVTETTQLHFLLGEGKSDVSYSLVEKESVTQGGMSVNARLKSFTGAEAETRIDSVELYPAPLELLEKVTVMESSQPLMLQTTAKLEGVTTFLPGVRKVSITPDHSQQSLVVLLQSFDRGWIAFPSSNMSKPLSHTVYNGWANGWYIDPSESSLIIFNVPQVIGVVLVMVTVVGCVYGLAYFWVKKEVKFLSRFVRIRAVIEGKKHTA